MYPECIESVIYGAYSKILKRAVFQKLLARNEKQRYMVIVESGRGNVRNDGLYSLQSDKNTPAAVQPHSSHMFLRIFLTNVLATFTAFISLSPAKHVSSVYKNTATALAACAVRQNLHQSWTDGHPQDLERWGTNRTCHPPPPEKAKLGIAILR